MTLEQCEQYLYQFPMVTKTFPFGPEVAVYKVADKMFALVSILTAQEVQRVAGAQGEQLWQGLPSTVAISLKCDPDRAQDYRLMFDGVLPGYHLNKMHWNTVFLMADVTAEQLSMMIEESYLLVVSGFPRARKEAIMLQFDMRTRGERQMAAKIGRTE